MRRAVFAIASGSAVGQILALFAAPALSRLFSPEEFGEFAAINAIALTFGAVAALKLDSAVPLPLNEREARQIVRTGILSSMATSTTLCVLAILAPYVVRRVFPGKFDAVLDLLWIAPLIAGTVGMVTVLNQWAIRHSRFGAIGRRNALNAAVMLTVQMIAGFAGLGTVGLAIGLLAGQAAACLALFMGSGLRWSRHSAGVIYDESRATLSRYKYFVLQLVPSNFLNSLGVYAPVLLLLIFYGEHEGGLYAMAQRILAAPVALLGRSIAQVYLGELAKTLRTSPREMLALFDSTSRKLLYVSLGIALIIAVGSIPLFPFVLGSEWALSGVVAVALSPFIAGQLAVSPLSQTLIVLERTRMQFGLDAIRVMVVAGVITAGALSGLSMMVTILLFSVVSAMYYFATWVCCRKALLHAGSAGGR